MVAKRSSVGVVGPDAPVDPVDPPPLGGDPVSPVDPVLAAGRRLAHGRHRLDQRRVDASERVGGRLSVRCDRRLCGSDAGAAQAHPQETLPRLS
jgi:hypothetical protein